MILVINPAGRRTIGICEDTCRMNNLRWRDNPLFQSSHRGYRFKCRSGSRLLLCCLAVQRTGMIQIQRCKISRIHGVGQPVIVISRIRHTGQHFTSIRICNHASGTARFQRKLSGCNFQFSDFIEHEIIGRVRTILKSSNRLLIILQNSLFIQE